MYMSEEDEDECVLGGGESERQPLFVKVKDSIMPECSIGGVSRGVRQRRRQPTELFSKVRLGVAYAAISSAFGK